MTQIDRDAVVGLVEYERDKFMQVAREYGMPVSGFKGMAENLLERIAALCDAQAWQVAAWRYLNDPHASFELGSPKPEDWTYAETRGWTIQLAYVPPAPKATP